jgi:BioD-like phosphotransacetylase family protein
MLTPPSWPLHMSHVELLLSSNQQDVLMEEIIANYHANSKMLKWFWLKARCLPANTSLLRR